MTFEEIQKANSTIKTTDYKNKDYAEVQQRVKAFRMLHPTGCIKTEMVYDDGTKCVFRTEVYDTAGHLLGTGTAYELKDNGFINKYSHIENCETSSVGRALAMCGIGIDTSIASYEEVANANETQNKKKTDLVDAANKKVEFLKQLNSGKYSNEYKKNVCDHYGVKEIEELTPANIDDFMKQLKEKNKNET